jgi:transcriptional regulator with XRE-family HTH domain
MSEARKRREEPRPEVRVLGRGLRARRGVHLTLRAVREAVGKTQVEIADASAIDQGDVSRLEARESLDECQVDTLRRYVAALGGELDLVATFGDKKISLTGSTRDAVGSPPNKERRQTRRPRPRDS